MIINYGSSHSLRVVSTIASLRCKVLQFLLNKAVFISLEHIFPGQEIGCSLAWKGEEARGREREGGDTGGREGVGVSVTLSARRRHRQNPTGSQSTHFRPDPPRQNHPGYPETALTSEPAQRCRRAPSGAQLQSLRRLPRPPVPSLWSERRVPSGSWTGVRVIQPPLRYKVSRFNTNEQPYFSFNWVNWLFVVRRFVNGTCALWFGHQFGELSMTSRQFHLMELVFNPPPNISLCVSPILFLKWSWSFIVSLIKLKLGPNLIP